MYMNLHSCKQFPSVVFQDKLNLHLNIESYLISSCRRKHYEDSNWTRELRRITMASSSLQVRVGVGAFILKSSRENPENPHFLFGKRRNAHGAGTYALPGGHLEFGETPEQCAAREVMEETGLKVSNVQFLTATNDYMPAEGKHYITLFTVCSRDNNDDEPQLLEPDKCEEWEWASWEDLMTWVKIQSEAREDTVLEKRLFLPFLDLVLQRPEVKIPII